MTAPDDVRARFEAWAIRQFGTSVQLRWIVQPNGDGYYKDEPADDCWDAYRAAHADLSVEVRELVEALKAAKRAYWLARSSAAGLTNYCEESASSRRCERELSEAESLWRSAEIEAALAKFTHQEKEHGS